MMKLLAICLILNLGILASAENCETKTRTAETAFTECTRNTDGIRELLESGTSIVDVKSDDLANITYQICSRYTIKLNCEEIKTDELKDCLSHDYEPIKKGNAIMQNIHNYFCVNDGEMLKEFLTNNGYHRLYSFNFIRCLGLVKLGGLSNKNNGVEVPNVFNICRFIKAFYICTRVNMDPPNQSLTNISKDIYTIIYDELECQRFL